MQHGRYIAADESCCGAAPHPPAGFVHRDLRWPNVIKVIPINGSHTIKLIDLELSGQAGDACSAHPYPLPHWRYDDGRSVLEPDGTYAARSNLRMVGKELLGKLDLNLLGASGLDLQHGGEYQGAGAALEHPWFSSA